jgi:hypothetical protein
MNDPEIVAWPEICATKIEAAKRQLDAGVRMLFAKEDALAVHTLAFAAYGLLADLSKGVGPTDTLRRLEADAGLREGKEFWDDLKRLANFLKHADRDPAEVIQGIPEELNEAALLIDCFLLREVSNLSSPESQALWLWHHALYFINIDDAPKEYWEWIDEVHPQLHADTREQRIDIGALLLQKLRRAEPGPYRMDPDQILLPWRLVIRPTIGSRRPS